MYDFWQCGMHNRTLWFVGTYLLKCFGTLENKVEICHKGGRMPKDQMNDIPFGHSRWYVVVCWLTIMREIALFLIACCAEHKRGQDAQKKRIKGKAIQNAEYQDKQWADDHGCKYPSTVNSAG